MWTRNTIATATALSSTMTVSLLKYVKSYFAETSLHGLKYITEDDRHPLERILWVVLFGMGVALEVSFMIPGA